MSIASWTSPAASEITLPISRAITSATSSLCSASSWPKRKRISPRFGAGVRRQSSKAAFAASTARSTSSALERGKTPSVSPVAGLVVSKVSPEAASTHSPPMKFLNVLVAAVATAAILVGRVGAGERARRPCPPAIADLAFPALVPARDPVLVPRDVPGDGEDGLAVGSREGHDRRLRGAEALGDAGDRSPEGAPVEAVGGLNHRQLGL